MARWKRFRAGRDGALTVSLAEEELGLLRSLPEQLRDVFEGDEEDPARARLFPRAYLDPTAESEEAEWQALVGPSLLRERLDALQLITVTLGRAVLVGEWWQIDLTPDEVQAWLGVLNDTRLVLGTRLGVTEEERALDPGDPDAGPYALYQWLTWVQGDLVEELL
ncbi:MAG TPA: DUF2017 family protein [Acidimicrobiia bacterium]|jgi:hypothetical protein|nr:DUF2017 family protein [Acidimicrobiia bacterium]